MLCCSYLYYLFYNNDYEEIQELTIVETNNNYRLFYICDDYSFLLTQNSNHFSFHCKLLDIDKSIFKNSIDFTEKFFSICSRKDLIVNFLLYYDNHYYIKLYVSNIDVLELQKNK